MSSTRLTRATIPSAVATGMATLLLFGCGTRLVSPASDAPVTRHDTGPAAVYDASPPAADTTPARVDTVAPEPPLPGCESLTKESAYCVALLSGPAYKRRVAMLGLDTRTLCEGREIGTQYFARDLAWLGSSLYYCDSDVNDGFKQSLFALDLESGALTEKRVPCSTLTDQGGGLLIDRYKSGLTWYASFDDAVRDEHGTSYPVIHSAGLNLAASGDLVYLGMVQVRELTVVNLRTSSIGKLVLQPKGEHYIGTMDVTPNGLLVTAWNRSVTIFDAATGKRRESYEVATPIFALSCRSRATP